MADLCQLTRTTVRVSSSQGISMPACDGASCAYQLDRIEPSETASSPRRVFIRCAHCADEIGKLTLRTDEEINAEIASA